MTRKNCVSLGMAFFAIIISFATLSCSKSNGWLSDYEEAQRLAKRQNKNIFLFISGEDWDGESTNTRTTIFETELFKEAAEKDYVLVQLDFSQSAYLATEVAEDATEEEKAKAAELAAKLEKDRQIAMNLNAMSMTPPIVMLITEDGYVFEVIAHNPEVTTPEQYIETLNTLSDKASQIKDLVKEVDKSRKEKKAAAIDALYDAIPSSHQYLLQNLIIQVPELDPNNTTGVVGEYEILAAYAHAASYLNEGDVLSAAKELTDVTESKYLKDDEKQYMFYMAASFYDRLGSDHVQDVVDCLQKAYDVAPESEIATNDIKPILDAYRGILEQTLADGQAAVEEAGEQ